MLVHNKSQQAINEIGVKEDLMQDFQMEEVSTVIMISERENMKMNTFEIWEQFESTFNLNYKKKIKKKYNEKSESGIENYLCFDNKE